MRKVLVPLAWILAALIVFVTLGPVGERPQFGHPQLERFAGFFVLAVCWSSAYPTRRIKVAAALTASAAVLEIGQWLVPGRDPGLRDVLYKIAGLLTGVSLAAAVHGAMAAKPRT